MFPLNSLSGLPVCLPEDKRESLRPMECQSFRPSVTFPKSLARVSQLPLVIWSSSVGEGHRSNIEKCTSSEVKMGGKVDTDFIFD